MRNVRVRLSYDGSRFFGWQRQEGFESVQEALEDAIESLTGEHVVVHGAGRTDTGVHALAQAANFHVATRLDDERLLFALNAHLPAGGVLNELETCDDGFHALRDAIGKHYVYVVATTRFRPAFGESFCHWVPGRLDVARMREAARVIVGEHDFTSFASAGSPRRTNVRRVIGLHLVEGRGRLSLAVRGNGFLYNMVRTIAGTLLEVGRGKFSAHDVERILEARDRSLAGPTAPAAGLYLMRVLYPQGVWPRTRA
ncbi:MAG TPA: tRNA pseudouridine(38-40) synthase TruA [Planctomycetes bacterium]|nr:tRNA pseudouridine(38-40) synthase TruA [Planctomycetota bacterium]